MSRSNRLKQYGVGLWMVAQMVMPVLVSVFTTVMTSLEVYESSPDVGSSRNSTRGLVTSAMPMFTRLHWPPAQQCPATRMAPNSTHCWTATQRPRYRAVCALWQSPAPGSQTR